MSAATRIGALAAASGLTALVALAPALPASAHGATTQPISRTAACKAGGTDAGSAACKAARKANGGPFGGFDNLRVPNVNGRDRQLIPDGELCSGGLDAYDGLNLARQDWPATKVEAGDTLSIRYATTIPHEGTFRLYLTTQGYDPGKKLRWDDVDRKAILVDKDPPLRDGAYRMTANLPKDRTGRHVLYVIWENSSTPDTYYSCSDLVVSAPPVQKAAAAPAKKKAKPKETTKAAPTAEPSADRSSPAAGKTINAAPASAERSADLGRPIMAGALLVLAAVTGAAGVLRLRRGRRAQRIPRRPQNR